MSTRLTCGKRIAVFLILNALTTGIAAAAVPAGFTEALYAGSLSQPTAMAFAPDGRLFVCEQRGTLRVVKGGSLLPTPFLSLDVDRSGERGLLGVAFDPDFVTNSYVYVYYTALTPVRHNRVSRFTANGDVAVSGSEVVLLELDDLSTATNHNGGALHFGPDGFLYIAVGDNANGANSQSFTTVLGKILRIGKDGTIPTNNPFYGTTSGINRAIWALGLRNPYTFAFDAATSVMFINDVGQSTWEEIDDGIAGANYGWPETEGPTSDPRFRGPRYAYQHSQGAPRGCAITGGAFYDPPNYTFPADYHGNYFFADYCAGWISLLNVQTNTSTIFATGLNAAVDLTVDSGGNLYYLVRGDATDGAGGVFRISYGAAAPGIATHPSDAVVAPGGIATFTVVASGTAPLSYQWYRNGAAIAGATEASYTTPPASTSDNGARYYVVVTNTYGTATSNDAILTVSGNASPTATIENPQSGSLYTAGMNVSVSGNATDPEDGVLPASAFSWTINFHHDSHIHPFLSGSGVKSGSFVIPTHGETSANVWYRINLEVRDSAGLTSTTYRDLLPRKSVVTLATSPSGLQLTLDGQPVTAPTSFEGVVGIVRSIGAAATQTLNGAPYEFVQWSDLGAANHDISTPAQPTTYTATYRLAACTAPPEAPRDLTGTLSGSTVTLQWAAPAAGYPPSGYRLEAGTAPNTTAWSSDLPAGTTSTSQTLPAGRFYVRVRALNNCGMSAPSNEITVQR